MTDQTVYQFKTKTLEGKEISLEDYRGKVLMIVNTASECGYTPQFGELEQLFRKYADQGFVVLGFPSNNFAQEPLEGKAIQEFCSENYDVTFPMMEKINVRGTHAHPLFHFFSKKKLNGKIASAPKWNFYKYLIGRDGKVISYFWFYRRPANRKIVKEIEKALAIQP